jgi:hypothetical protein
MSDERRDHSWYRDEAKRLRQRAAAITNDDQLRDSYRSLAREYDRLADVLENRSPQTPST